MSIRLDRVKELFDTEIMTRLDNPKKGGVVIVAHRIAEDDLSGYAMQQKGWEQLKLPFIARRARRYELGNGMSGSVRRVSSCGQTHLTDAISPVSAPQSSPVSRPYISRILVATSGCG